MQGRPKLKEEDRRKFFGVTVSPEAAGRLEAVKGNKSQFIDELLKQMPEKWIRAFNKAPGKFSLETFGK